MDKVKSIPIKIIYRSQKYIKVKLPFIAIPIKMGYKFFDSRLEEGYFTISENKRKDCGKSKFGRKIN